MKILEEMLGKRKSGTPDMILAVGAIINVEMDSILDQGKLQIKLQIKVITWELV